MVAEAEEWAVVPSVGAPFTTTYKPLAREVARIFDRIDPLPYPPHDCGRNVVSFKRLSGHGRSFCEDCGRSLD